MTELLRRYFFTFQTVSLPNIGTLLAKPVSAVLDFPARALHAPKIETVLLPVDAIKLQTQVEWLASVQSISTADASEALHAFAQQILNTIEEKDEFLFEDICVLHTSPSGFVCTSKLDTASLFPPQHAEKIIREQETHMVRVGETERSSTEMEAMLSETQQTQKDHWWVAGILLFVLAIGAWYYFYASHPQQSQRHSFFHLIKPKEAPATYRNWPE